MFKKKGSLELSVNAIVIIIIAMAMLGVGTYFIKNVFGGAADKLDDALNGIDDQTRESFLDRCTDEVCIQDTLELDKGERKTLLLAINNKYDCELNQFDGSNKGISISEVEDSCQTIDTLSCEGIKISTLARQIVAQGEKRLIPVVVDTKQTTNVGIYQFAIQVQGKCSTNPATAIDTVKYFNVQVNTK